MKDKHKAHDVVHTFYGGKAENCPHCKGEWDEKQMCTEAGKIATENYKPRVNPQVSYDQRLMQYAEEDGTIPTVDSKAVALRDMDSDMRTMIDVLQFGEKKAGDEIPTHIKVIPYGKYKMARYGEVTIDRKKIEEMVKHFEEDVRASTSTAGLPIDVEHGTTVYKDAAAGWLKKLSAGEDGGYADVEWTKLGKHLLGEKIYKFYSPEFWFKYIDPENTDVKLDNVMTGGGLVNKPMIKHDLKPIVNSENGGENTPLTDDKKTNTIFLELTENLHTASANQNMQLSEILKKAKADRTSDEQKFVVDHKDELTFAEAKKEGFAEDKSTEVKTEAKGVQLSEGQMVVDKAKFDGLVSLAEKGAEAADKLKKAELKEKVEKAVFSEKGTKMAKDQVDVAVDLLVTMSEENQEKYLKQLESLPEKAVFTENGSEHAKTASAAGKELETKIQKYMEDNKVGYAAAASAVTASNPEQLQEYKESMPVAQAER